MRLTSWGKEAQEWQHRPGTVLLLKDVKVADYKGFYLSILWTSKVIVMNQRSVEVTGVQELINFFQSFQN